MRLIIKKENSRYRLGIILACFYIFFTFVSQGLNLSENVTRMSLYLFLIWATFSTLSKKSIVLNSYIKWYLIFACFCFFSLIYAQFKPYGINSIYSLMVAIGVIYAFSLAIESKEDFIIIFWTYLLSSTLLFIIIAISGKLHIDERLGTSLFGNANTFAAMFMISSFCTIWLFIYNRGIKKVISIIAFLAQMYALALSGGRKYFIIPFIFMYLILFFKRDFRGKTHVIKSTLIFCGIAIMLYWSIFNVPVIYSTVGHRLESLINMVTGSGYIDTSALTRKQMINFGFDLWLDKPLLGYGINNFMGAYGNSFTHYTYSHNNYIELLVDLGLTGFVIYYSFYIWIMITVRIKNDTLGLVNFFQAYILCLFIFEIGAVTYNLTIIQTFLAFPAIYKSRCLK